MENKERITHQLMLCILATRAGEDISDMSYFKGSGDEWVSITFKDGSWLPVNVTADSGIALIKDVSKALT